MRRKAWDEILTTSADEVFSIGTVNGIRQPIVVGPKVRNVPKEGYYAWDPGGYIGLYQPDTFWIEPVGPIRCCSERGEQRLACWLDTCPLLA